MEQAVEHYAADRNSSDAWMLGRFVVPVQRLGEFARAYGKLPEPEQGRWPLHVIGGDDLLADANEVIVFNASSEGPGIVAIETGVYRDADSMPVVAPIPPAIEMWFEQKGGGALSRALAAPNRGATMELGGTSGVCPSPVQVGLFLQQCRAAHIAVRFTGGLNHVLGGTYALPHEKRARVRMFGFLNLVLAAVLVAEQAELGELVAALTEQDPESLECCVVSVRWRDRWFSLANLVIARRFLRSFGCGSFLDPVQGLRDLHWV